MKSEINPERLLERKSEEVQSISRKQKKIFQSPSSSHLKSSEPLPSKTYNPKRTPKNHHIPAIFKKDNQLQNSQSKIQSQLYTSSNNQNVTSSVFCIQSSQKILPMASSLGLPQISNYNLRKKSQNNPLCGQLQQLGSNKAIRTTLWLSKSPKAQNKSPRNFLQKRETLFTPGKVPPFLKNRTKPKIEHSLLKLSGFKITKYLGKGGFGQYYQAIHKQSGLLVCLKQIQKGKIIENKLVDKVVLSISRNFQMNHPHIRKLYGIFQEENNIYLILQYCQNKTLASYLKNHHFSESEGAQRIKQIGSALKYIHEKNLVHRSLNTQSILMTEGVCKLWNFELMSECTQKYKNKYAFSDVNREEPNWNLKAQVKTVLYGYDIWCLGLVAYQILTGKSIQNDGDIKNNKKLCQIDIKNIIFPQELSNSAENLILGLLQPISKNRMTIEQMFQHPLIIEYKEENLWQKYSKNDGKDDKSTVNKSQKYFKLKRAFTNT